MESAQTTPVVDGPAPEPDPGSGAETALREAMLEAIGELSEAERERLQSVAQPVDMAQAWRDLIAERAARDREATVRTELTREFQDRSAAGQPRPTQGLHGEAPGPTPHSVTAWTEFIHATTDGAQRQRRRDQFAAWLAANPDA